MRLITGLLAPARERERECVRCAGRTVTFRRHGAMKKAVRAGCSEKHMNDQASHRPSLFARRSSPRALLAPSATVGAGGTAAAVVGIASQTGGTSNPSAKAAALSGGAGSATPQPIAGAQRPIDDPVRGAAHLLRRAGFGGTLAEIHEFS